MRQRQRRGLERRRRCCTSFVIRNYFLCWSLECAGYQRELNYRHADGSYSAFGKSDAQGSLWLTAFVVKSFAAARRYIHIDDAELQASVHWLTSKQLENGCFPIVGTVLHKDLKVMQTTVTGAAISTPSVFSLPGCQTINSFESLLNLF